MKPRFDLLPEGVLEEIVKVLTFGAGKHSDHGWKEQPDLKEKYTAAALRHIEKRLDNVMADHESGRSHLAHAISDLMFVLWADIQDRKTE